MPNGDGRGLWAPTVADARPTPKLPAQGYLCRGRPHGGRPLALDFTLPRKSVANGQVGDDAVMPRPTPPPCVRPSCYGNPSSRDDHTEYVSAL